MKKILSPFIYSVSILSIILLASACSCRATQEDQTSGISGQDQFESGSEYDLMCFPDQLQATPRPEDAAILSVDEEQDWILGAEAAAVTIVMYGDFYCPECGFVVSYMDKVLEQFPEDVRFVYRNFPQETEGGQSYLAAQAAEAAGMQDAYWEMYQILYTSQLEWMELPEQEFQDWLVEKAGELELDQGQFLKDLDSNIVISRTEEDHQRATADEIPQPPYVKINNTFELPPNIDFLATAIELILLENKKVYQCPDITIDPKGNYRAILKTEKGDITIKLFPDKAPIAVNSFIYLAETDWYDNNTFHLVKPGNIAQTGDPSGTGFGSPGFLYRNEISNQLRFDRKGLVATANSGPDSNGSQFFITYDALPELDGQHTIFGEVIDGMDVVENLTPREAIPGQDLPSGDKLLDVVIEE